MYKRGKRIITVATFAFLINFLALSKVCAITVTQVQRLGGKNRYETAAKISEEGWKNGCDTVLIASGEGYADALCAAPLAKIKNAPILLTSKDKLNDDILKELKRLKVKKVYIIGGEGSISKNVEDKIKVKITQNIERIYGKDRYETSIKIAEKIGKVNKVIIASGEGYADALSVAPMAAINKIPIILTKSNSLSLYLRDYIKSSNISEAYVIGGITSISDNVENLLPKSKRICGENRFATNRAVIKAFEGDVDFKNVYLALGVGQTGNEFADALAGSALVARNNGALILTGKNLDTKTKELIEERISPTSKITILGGGENIPGRVANSIKVIADVFDKKEEIYNQDIKGNAIVTTEDVEVGDSTIYGNLYIEGNNAILQNLTVRGNIFINLNKEGECNLEEVEANKIVFLSPVKNTIYLKDVKAKELDVISKGNGRIVLQDTSKFLNTKVSTSVVLQNIVGSFGNIDVLDTFNDKKVELNGTIDKIMNIKGNVKLISPSGNYIEKVQINSDKDDEIFLDGKFKEVEVYNGVNIKTTSNTETTIEAKNLEAKLKAKIDIRKGSKIKIKNFNENNVTGEGKNNITIV